MPVYYFHVREHGALIKDVKGLELPDLEAASDECRKLIISVLQEEELTEEFSANREFQIEDAGRRTVLVVPFRLALSRLRAAQRE